ncbi:MAG TPA: methyltransferase domain-containing protein, partial [Stellaceae bacterium]
MAWDPAQYLKFAGPRLRPAIDLLGHIEAAAPKLVYDLGCGAGNMTRFIAERWPSAKIVGVDGSAEMLAKARADLPHIEWQQADLAAWRPPQAPDVIYSNAALHWIEDHAPVFVRLFESL